MKGWGGKGKEEGWKTSGSRLGLGLGLGTSSAWDGDASGGRVGVGVGGEVVPIRGDVLVRLLGRERVSFAVGLGCVGVGTWSVMNAPLVTGAVFETCAGVAGRDPGALPGLLGRLFGLWGLEVCVTAVYVRTMSAAGERAVRRLRTAVFANLLLQRMPFFDRHGVGALGSAVAADVAALRGLVVSNLGRDRGLRAASEAVGVVASMFMAAPSLAPVLVGPIVALAAGAWLFGRRLAKLFAQDAQEQGRLASAAVEAFGGVRVVRSFRAEAREVERCESRGQDAQTLGTTLGATRAAAEAFNRGVIYASLGLLYGFGSGAVLRGQLALGAFSAFVGYTFILTFAVQGVLNTLADAQKAKAALDRIVQLAGEHLDPHLVADVVGVAALGKEAPAEAVPHAEVRALDVTFDGVEFTYASRPDAPVLRGVDLVFEAGRQTALVGPSGAGKSTVAALLNRFYDPEAGTIALGGVPLQNYHRGTWSDAVALVGQDALLFSGSVFDNIAYGLTPVNLPGGRPPATDAELRALVEAAARSAHAHEFVEALPQGYDTDVGERGGRLSGGQRQRVALARAFLKNAPLLVLDEATSALDAESERLIQAAVERLVQGRTTVVIAHRLSTVKSADRIYVFDGGRVVEQGSHAQLVAHDGLYAGLVQAQDVTVAVL